MVVFSRKSWVTAMPIEANANEVRSQARNVRSARKAMSAAGVVRNSSVHSRGLSISRCWGGSTGIVRKQAGKGRVSNQELGDLLRHFLYYPARHFHTCPRKSSTILHHPPFRLRTGSMTDDPVSSKRYVYLSMDPAPHPLSDSMLCHKSSILPSPFRQLA